MIRTERSSAGPPLNERDLVSFEKRLGGRLPQPYREFLRATNGGSPEMNTFHFVQADGVPNTDDVSGFYGISSPIDGWDLIWAVDLYAEWLKQQDLIPICTSSGGNQVFIDVVTGRLFHWEYATNAMTPLAPSFEAFEAMLYRGAAQPPFDEDAPLTTID